MPASYARSYLRHARNSDAAFFWIPAFAGMTSCPPFDFAQDRLRRASRVVARMKSGESILCPFLLCPVVAWMKSGESLAPFSFFAIFVKADVSSVKDPWYARAKKTPKFSKRYEFLSLAHIVLS